MTLLFLKKIFKMIFLSFLTFKTKNKKLLKSFFSLKKIHNFYYFLNNKIFKNLEYLKSKFLKNQIQDF